MTIGQGIALVAVWALPVTAAIVKRVTGFGLFMACVTALLATSIIIK
jgi:hypothetical protein